MTTEELRLEELREVARSFEPSARVFIKDNNFLMVLINFVVGRFNKAFMTNFATTICRTIYIPRSWLGKDLNRLLCHECRHITQCRWCGFGLHPWIGFIPYAFIYGLLFFPIMLAYFRYRFELDADVAAWKYSLDKEDATTDGIIKRAERFGGIVGSWDYLQPWPSFWVRWGFKRKAEETIDRHTMAKGSKHV